MQRRAALDRKRWCETGEYPSGDRRRRDRHHPDHRLGIELLHAGDTRGADRHRAAPVNQRVLWHVLGGVAAVGCGRPIGRAPDRSLWRAPYAGHREPGDCRRSSDTRCRARDPGLVIAWAVLGIGIGMGLYDPAFAALTWLYGREARSAITGITLIAGFASTIGWPLSALFLHEFGWRAACLIWAGLNVLLAAPVNWLAIPRTGAPTTQPRAAIELWTACAAARGDADPGLLFRRHLVRSRSDGGASSGFAEGGRCVVDGGDRRRGIGRTGAGRRPPHRVWTFAFVPPGFLGAYCRGAAPDRCCVSPRVRRSRDHRVRAVARRRQRHDHDRQGHLAAGVVRAARLRAAQWVALGAGPGAAVGRAVSVRPVARPGRGRGGVAVGRALHRRLRLTVRAAPQPCACAQAPRRPAAEPHSIIPSTSALD